MEYLQNSAEFARDHQIKLHLDGARIFNAAVERNVSVEAIAKNFDSVSICLSKGLGAPVGSLLCGSKDQISKARRWRKMLGGGMRQAGILAAGCIYALENNIDRLAEDHDKAARLASGLNGIQQTNMVFLRVGKVGEELLPAFLKDRGILISAGETIRFVTHMDIRERDIDTVIVTIEEFFSKMQS